MPGEKGVKGIKTGDKKSLWLLGLLIIGSICRDLEGCVGKVAWLLGLRGREI